MATLETSSSSPASSSSGDSAKRALREACSECRLMHKGCDRCRPCGRCTQRGVPHKCCDPKDDPRCAQLPKSAADTPPATGADRFFPRMNKGSNNFPQPVMMFNPQTDLPMPLLMSLMYSGGMANGSTNQASPLAAAAAQMFSQQQQQQLSPNFAQFQQKGWPFTGDLSSPSSSSGTTGMFQSVPCTPAQPVVVTASPLHSAQGTTTNAPSSSLPKTNSDPASAMFGTVTFPSTNCTPPATEFADPSEVASQPRMTLLGSVRPMPIDVKTDSPYTSSITLESGFAYSPLATLNQQQPQQLQIPHTQSLQRQPQSPASSGSAPSPAIAFSSILPTDQPFASFPIQSQPQQQQQQLQQYSSLIPTSLPMETQQSLPTASPQIQIQTPSFWLSTSDEVPEAALTAAAEAAQEQEMKEEPDHPPVIIGPEGPVCPTESRLGGGFSAPDLFFDLDDFFSGETWQESAMSPVQDLTVAIRSGPNSPSSSSTSRLQQQQADPNIMCDPLTGLCYRTTDGDGHISKKRLLGEAITPNLCVLPVCTPAPAPFPSTPVIPPTPELLNMGLGRNPIITPVPIKQEPVEDNSNLREIMENLKLVSMQNLSLQKQVRDLQSACAQQQRELETVRRREQSLSDEKMHPTVFKNVLDIISDTAMHSPRSVVVIRDVCTNKVVYMNKNMTKIFKYSEAEYARGDVRWYHMIHPQYHKEFLNAMERVNRSQNSRRCEVLQCIVMAKDSRLYESNIFLGSVQDESGAIKYRTTVFLPISELNCDPEAAPRETMPEALH